MLKQHINGFIDYCKVSGFRVKSIESLSTRLNNFNNFIQENHLESIQEITYRHLLAFPLMWSLPMSSLLMPHP